MRATLSSESLRKEGLYTRGAHKGVLVFSIEAPHPPPSGGTFSHREKDTPAILPRDRRS